MSQDFYSIKEFAKKLNVCEKTIRRAIQNGRINAFRVSDAKHSIFRIPATEIQRMAIIDLQIIIVRTAKKLMEDNNAI